MRICPKARLGKAGIDKGLGKIRSRKAGSCGIQSCKIGKIKLGRIRLGKIGLGLVLAIAVGVIYWLRKRSLPLEDPWAEEYWANLSTPNDLPDLPVETVDG